MKTDARKKPCPQPVVMALNELKELHEGEYLEVLVDNREAVENLTRMAAGKGLGVSSGEEGADFIVRIGPAEGSANCTANCSADGGRAEEGSGSDAAAVTCPAGAAAAARPVTVAAIGSDRMGSGDDDLGRILVKSFLFSLTQMENVPDTVLFFNGGARLTTEGSGSLEDIRKLEERGAVILTCGTCLDFLGIKDKLAVGGVTNMYEIADRMFGADRLVRI